MTRSHTHGCPSCGTITQHHCTGRDVGAPDSPPLCQYEADNPDDFLCDDCYEAKREREEREDRDAARATEKIREAS